MKYFNIGFVPLACCIVCTLLFLGCEGGSSNDVISNVSADFSGLYSGNTEGTESLIKHPSDGSTIIRSLQLIQTGSELEAFDNFGGAYRGNIQYMVETEATFILEDPATGGNQVTMTGTLAGSGDTATMRGAYITPGYTANIYGSASITPIQSNAQLQVSGPTSMSANTTSNFTASGGSGAYTWSISVSAYGTPSSGSGATFSYTATSSNVTQTITVNDGTTEAYRTVNQQ